jgi:hypothetical protein
VKMTTTTTTMMMMMMISNRTALVWNVKSEVILVITGPSETIRESFRKYPSNILGKHDIKEL